METMMKSATASIPRSFDDDWTPRYFYILAVCLAVALMTTNIIAFKFIQVFGFKFGAGTLMFPACLIVGDLTTEVYGFRRSRKVILLSLACYFVFMLFTQLAIWLPPAPEWKDQAAFSQVFGQAPRIFVAGAFAYLAGELSNSLVMSRMKIRDNGKHFWRRAMASAIVGELANTSVFMSVAWAGKMGLWFLLPVILNGTLIKIVVQALVLPVTTALAIQFKSLEGVDHFDGRPTETELPLRPEQPVPTVCSRTNGV